MNVPCDVLYERRIAQPSDEVSKNEVEAECCVHSFHGPD